MSREVKFKLKQIARNLMRKNKNQQRIISREWLKRRPITFSLPATQETEDLDHLPEGNDLQVREITLVIKNELEKGKTKRLSKKFLETLFTNNNFDSLSYDQKSTVIDYILLHNNKSILKSLATVMFGRDDLPFYASYRNGYLLFLFVHFFYKSGKGAEKLLEGENNPVRLIKEKLNVVSLPLYKPDEYKTALQTILEEKNEIKTQSKDDSSTVKAEEAQENQTKSSENFANHDDFEIAIDEDKLFEEATNSSLTVSEELVGPTVMDTNSDIFGEQALYKRNLIKLINEQNKDKSKVSRYKWYCLWCYYLNMAFDGHLANIFLSFKPNLARWQDVWTRVTPKQAINFVVNIMNVYGFYVEPNMWAGKSVRSTLVVYYIYIKQSFIVFCKEEGQFYQYTGIYWKFRTAIEITEDIVQFASSLSVMQSDKTVSVNDSKELLSFLKAEVTITKWPIERGLNCLNGYFTLEQGRYVLKPHHPGHWARKCYQVTIPEEIINSPNILFIRFLLDISSEQLLNLNLLQIFLYYCTNTERHNLIMNLSGNPSGAKSLFVKLVQQFVGTEHCFSGNLSNLNNFQRLEMMKAHSLVHFPDNSPKYLGKDAINLLKAASGRDSIRGEEKFAGSTAKPLTSTIIITNNDNFEDVPAYKEPGMYERVLNLVFGSINSSVAVPNLYEFLEPYAQSLFDFGLQLEPKLVTASQRSRDLNAASGAGVEQPLLQFLITRTIFKKGGFTRISALQSQYATWLSSETTDPNQRKALKKDSKAGFKQSLNYFLNRLTPKGIDLKRRAEGMGFSNLVIADPSKSEIGERFVYQPDSQLEKDLNKNPFRFDSFTFLDKLGSPVQGPRLNPQFNIEMFGKVLSVRETNCKDLISNSVTNIEGRHFEQTNFGFGQTIDSLKFLDFLDDEPVQYQDKIMFLPNSPNLILDTEELVFTDQTKRLLGVEKGVILLPHKEVHPGIAKINSALGKLENYLFSRKYFLTDYIPQNEIARKSVPEPFNPPKDLIPLKTSKKFEPIVGADLPISEILKNPQLKTKFLPEGNENFKLADNSSFPKTNPQAKSTETNNSVANHLIDPKKEMNPNSVEFSHDTEPLDNSKGDSFSPTEPAEEVNEGSTPSTQPLSSEDSNLATTDETNFSEQELEKEFSTDTNTSIDEDNNNSDVHINADALNYEDLVDDSNPYD